MLLFRPRFVFLVILLCNFLQGKEGIDDGEDALLAKGEGGPGEEPGQKEDDEGEPNTEEPLEKKEVEGGDGDGQEDETPGEVEVVVEEEEEEDGRGGEKPRRRVQRVERGMGMGVKEETEGGDQEEEEEEEEEIEWKEGMMKRPRVGKIFAS